MDYEDIPYHGLWRVVASGNSHFAISIAIIIYQASVMINVII
jgi:hypothetical protein